MTIKRFEHDTTVRKLRVLGTDDALHARVTELFIASVATGERRAMTPLIAFHAARNLPAHDWVRFDHAAHGQLIRFEGDIPCAVCGIHRQAPAGSDCSGYGLFDRAAQIADFVRAGRCSTSPDYSHLIDLEDVPNLTLAYQPAHADALHALLRLIESVPAGASTTDLQKRVSAAKVMPRSNLAARLWCLRILAELGVITNAGVPGYSGAFHFYSFLQRMEMERVAFAHMSHRADPVWPLSAGRGHPAVDWSLARRVFPQLDA